MSFVAAVPNGFVLDDIVHIEQNALLGSGQALLHAWSEPIFPGNLYRPLTSFVNALLALLFGVTPAVFVVANVLLHGCVAWLAYKLITRLSTSEVAFFSSALFAVHPLHIEVVANATGKAELLAAVFVLGSLNVAIDSERKSFQKMVFTGLLAFLAFCSKESSFCLLLLIPLTLYFQHSKIEMKSLLPVGIAAIAYLSCRLLALGGIFGASGSIYFVDNPLVALGTVERVINALLLLQRYLALCIVPVPLSADYSFAHLAPPLFDHPLLIAVSGASLIGILASGIHLLRKGDVAGYFIAWFYLSFAVTGNILLPIGTIFAERLAYLPSIGVIGFIVYALTQHLRQSIKIPLLVVLCSAGAFYCNFGSMWWRSQESLFERQIKISPESVKTLINYGVVERNRKNYDRAESLFKKALAVDSEFIDARFALASLYAVRNESEKALHFLTKTLELNANHYNALELAGRIHFNRGNIRRARKLFERALRVKPEHTGCLSGLAAVAISEQDYEQASRIINKLNGLTGSRASEVQMLQNALSRARSGT